MTVSTSEMEAEVGELENEETPSSSLVCTSNEVEVLRVGGDGARNVLVDADNILDSFTDCFKLC